MALSDDLYHYGTPRHSGRYPWGSGNDPYQSQRDFLGQVAALRGQGLTELQIAKGMGLSSTTELRAQVAIARNAKRAADAAQALRLHDKGMSNVAIGQRMGINESSVRNLLNPAAQDRNAILNNTVAKLKQRVDSGAYVDIGKGAERASEFGISENKLATAVAVLKQQGYQVHLIQQTQAFGKGKTTIKVLAPAGTKTRDIYQNTAKIQSLQAFSPDGGRHYYDMEAPASIDPKRVAVLHKGEGGENADGVVYIRPGVPDVSLGGARYMQVRIKVGDAHYIKGMAMYKDGLPEGVDLLYNTSKPRGEGPLDALKATKEDQDNPFGSIVRQYRYTDAQGKEHLSPINVVNEEGDWEKWHPSLSSQMLSKQSTDLARHQLGITLADHEAELAQLRSLTNPAVKRKLLTTFADEADAAAVHLKAAALPRQGTHVILPVQSLRPNEIYAPKYNNGEQVALIRHPHGGIFEIPVLTVNNKNREAIRSLGPVPGKLGHAQDAVGIHPSVAKLLSGADFDGDAVLVIPNNRRTLRTASPLEGLKNFDAHAAYPPYDGMHTIDGGVYNAKTGKVDYGSKHPAKAPKQQKMGDVSNLITDMTIKGASHDEIARAVRHSMVVIDADKHMLNYKQSAIDNGIAELKAKYQGKGPTGRLAGASTLISRAGSQKRVPKRIPRPAREGGPIDVRTGKRVYVQTGETYTTRGGKVVPLTTRTTKLADVQNAFKLVSKPGTPMEEIYAAHSNALKSLANQARLESLRTGKIAYSPSAARAYRPQVARLNAALNLALKNAPLERQAQLIAARTVAAKVYDNPLLKSDPDALKKVQFQALNTARDRIVGAKKHQITISSDEWRAIQAGAITQNKLEEILRHSNLDKIKELATPRTTRVITPALLARARSRLAAGFTQAEVAKSLGISASSLSKALQS